MSGRNADGDVAIAHDQFRTMGGAERVAVEMARALDAPIYCGRVDDGVAPDDIETHEVFTSSVGQRAMRSHYLVQDLYQMISWQHVEDLYEFDTVVINKTNPGWFVPKDTQTTIWYLHSTPRGLYDQFHRRGGHWLTAVMKTPMRVLYTPNTRYADAWACNSELIQRRMDRYWDVPKDEVDVIYPPVPTQSFGQTHATDCKDDFYLTLSRLQDHKRIDHIISAFNDLAHDEQNDYRLVVAGDGPERESLEAMAGDNVEFAGYVSEERKARLLADAKAFVFAAENEDFGIAPIEAFASGTPVIGVNEGYTQHQIIDGKNGKTFSIEGGHLREGIRRFERNGVEWEAGRIAKFAERFSAARFREEIADWVARAREDSAVEVDWEVEPPEKEPPETADPVVTDGGDLS